MFDKNNELDTLLILDLLGQKADLTVVLDMVTNWLESLIPDALVSVMLYSEEEQHLNLISGGQHFSALYKDAIKDLKIGPQIGACGAAAFERKMVICENLATDPNWQPYQELIQRDNIAACWSVPIINAQGVLYGTFATYYRHPKPPTDFHIKLLQRAASLVALGMDLHDERRQKIAMHEKYRSFFDHHPDGVFEHDLEGYIRDANMTSKQISGFALKQIYGLHYSQVILPEYLQTAKAAFERAVAGDIQRIEIQAYRESGQSYWIDLTYLPIFNDQKIVGVFGVVRDISQRRMTEEYLRLLKRGVDANPHGIIITEATEDNPIVYVNPAFTQITGYTEEETLGRNCRFLQGPETDQVIVQHIQQAITERREIKTLLKNYRKDGSWFWNQLILSPVLDEQGICTHFISIQQDITQQRIDEEYINYQRTHDSLTGLANRQTFEEQLDLAFHLQHNSSHPLIVLYIELDDFRPLNESLGYFLGDQLLRLIAKRLHSVLQPDDVLSRFAGGEFALLLNKSRTQQQAAEIAEDILRLLAAPFNVDDHNIHLSASIGIALDTRNNLDFQELLQHAMQAMHHAKNEGGNTWVWYADHRKLEVAVDYAQLRHELMIALQEQQFQLFYQPIIDSISGQITGVEALIRWHHPEQGLISPPLFIPLAERTGQIIAIGHWVLQQACKDIVQLNLGRTRPLSVAVNISPLQFRRTGFLNELQEVLAEHQLNPELLKIEVTEGVLIMGAERSIELLKSIRALGIKVAIDDFGTGYSSLSYLRQLPIDELKLDRSFIQHLAEHQDDAAIVDAIISMANTLDLTVVAEGVETAEQVEFLQQHQCKYLQGFYFARPVSLQDLTVILTNHRFNQSPAS